MGKTKHKQLFALLEKKKTTPVSALVVPSQFYAPVARSFTGFSSAICVAAIKGDLYSTLKHVSEAVGLSEGTVIESLRTLCAIGMVEKTVLHGIHLYRLTESICLCNDPKERKQHKKTRKVTHLQQLAKWIGAQDLCRIDTNFIQRGKRLRCL